MPTALSFEENSAKLQARKEVKLSSTANMLTWFFNVFAYCFIYKNSKLGGGGAHL